MTLEASFVLVVLVTAAALFASDRFRMDLIGFGALTALLVGGILNVPEALAGFSDPTVHMIAGLFLVGGAVFETGLADRFGTLLERFGGDDPKKLLAVVLIATAALSAFLSSTGTVALLVPVVASLARRSGTSPSKWMIPLAFTTLLGGLLTLIATAPNLVVSNALADAGFQPFHFFSFTGPGLCFVAIGIAFLLLVSDRLLPERIEPGRTTLFPSLAEIWHRYGLSGWLFELRVLPGSPLVGRTIAESEVRSRFGVAIFAIEDRTRPRDTVERASADRRLEAGHLLTVKGPPERVEFFASEARLEHVTRPEELPQGLVVAEVLVPPQSALLGKSVADARLRSRFDVTVMGIFRSSEVLRASVAQTKIAVGDLLLLIGTGKSLVKLRDELPDVILVTESEALQKAAFRREKTLPTLTILIALLVALATGVVPAVLAVMAAALALVVSGAIEARRAEKLIHWESILLLATILPLATALRKVGVIDSVASGMASALAQGGPRLVLAALFALTSLVGLFLSNTATAVLVAPIALQIAARLHLAPHALLMTVAVAASSAFLTPVSSPVNMLVVNAGGYRFGDFTRVGLPLLLLVGVANVILLPFFFPL